VYGEGADSHRQAFQARRWLDKRKLMIPNVRHVTREQFRYPVFLSILSRAHMGSKPYEPQRHERIVCLSDPYVKNNQD
jgi:hypothetical protein